MRSPYVATIWLYRCVLMLTAFGLCACERDGPQATAVMSDKERIEQGRIYLERYQCGACHTIPGVAQARGREGPSLDQFGRRSYVAGNIPNTEALLAKWILNPHALIATTSMPNMGVPHEDAQDMAIYLRSLR